MVALLLIWAATQNQRATWKSTVTLSNRAHISSKLAENGMNYGCRKTLLRGHHPNLCSLIFPTSPFSGSTRTAVLLTGNAIGCNARTKTSKICCGWRLQWLTRRSLRPSTITDSITNSMLGGDATSLNTSSCSHYQTRSAMKL